MKKLAVVAIGSRLMKDDGIAVRVAEAIGSTLIKADVDVVNAETDFEFGLEIAMDYEYVIVLDAMAGGNTPGKVTVLSFSDAKAQKRYASQHDMSLVDMMVREGMPSGYLIGIEAENAGFGFDLSKTLQERFEAICEDVQAEVLKIKKRLTSALKENK